MLTPREATEAPRQGSRSPFSPTEVTESATVRRFLILSALLCSANNVDLKIATWLLYCLRLRSRSPHNAQHSCVRVIWRALTHTPKAYSPTIPPSTFIQTTPLNELSRHPGKGYENPDFFNLPSEQLEI